MLLVTRVSPRKARRSLTVGRTKRLRNFGPRTIGAVAALTCLFGIHAAHAEIPELEWSDLHQIDTGVAALGDSGGRSAVYNPAGDGSWQAVYTKGQDVYFVEGNASGWSTPVSISDDPSASRAPSIASSGGAVHVTWEDERSGHPEVWTRRLITNDWSEAECLTCDAMPSRSPAIDGTGDLGAESSAYLVWEEDLGAGGTAILGRRYSVVNGSWNGTETVSESTSSATEPTLSFPSIDAGGWGSDDLVVAWTDARHGESEIYARKNVDSSNEWDDEERATDVEGNCARPRITQDVCCFDQIGNASSVAFENDQTGVVETWHAYSSGYAEDWTAERVSSDDGIPSHSPDVAGIKFLPSSCYEFDDNVIFLSWTDDGTEGTTREMNQYSTSNGSEDSGLSLPVGEETTGALVTHSSAPEAPLLQFWVGADGVLQSRFGTKMNCRLDELVSATDHYLYVEPAGGPNLATLTEVCRDEPVPDADLRLEFYSGLAGLIAFDPEEDWEPIVRTNDNGVATIVLRGGGCVTDEAGGNGVAILGCPWWGTLSGPFEYYVAVKSPDIDGTCSVDQWDVDYVQASLATDDFCADLDGSGWVDQLDLDIVLAALGDACSVTTSVEDSPSDDTLGDELSDGLHRMVRVVPNPGRDRFEIRLRLDPGEVAKVRVMDVSGRAVRELSDITSNDGGASPASVHWDGQDERGRAMPTGVYFADVVVSFEGSLTGRARTAIVVTR